MPALDGQQKSHRCWICEPQARCDQRPTHCRDACGSSVTQQPQTESVHLWHDDYNFRRLFRNVTHLKLLSYNSRSKCHHLERSLPRFRCFFRAHWQSRSACLNSWANQNQRLLIKKITKPKTHQLAQRLPSRYVDACSRLGVLFSIQPTYRNAFFCYCRAHRGLILAAYRKTHQQIVSL